MNCEKKILTTLNCVVYSRYEDYWLIASILNSNQQLNINPSYSRVALEYVGNHWRIGEYVPVVWGRSNSWIIPFVRELRQFQIATKQRNLSANRMFTKKSVSSDQKFTQANKNLPEQRSACSVHFACLHIQKPFYPVVIKKSYSRTRGFVLKYGYRSVYKRMKLCNGKGKVKKVIEAFQDMIFCCLWLNTFLL